MPILIRIVVQRALVGMLSVLAFFGITPEINVNMDQTGPIVITDQSEEISDLLESRDIKNNTQQETATPSAELEQDAYTLAQIPLPQKNILEEIRQRASKLPVTNISGTNEQQTNREVFAPVPNKSNPSIPSQSIALPQPEAEIVIPVETETISQFQIDAFEEALQKELEREERREKEKAEKQAELERIAKEKAAAEKNKTVRNDSSEKSTIENSVVNIQCVRRNGNQINLSTGSGVIISPNGVVVTNSHVAQYFLLEELGYTCTLQRENSSLYAFKAAPLYISEDWIGNNFMLLSHPAPTGTGEDDYALLYITESTIPSISLPSAFSYMSPNTQNQAVDIGDSVTAAGYPGKSSGSFEIDSSLKLVQDRTSITNIFTFGRSSVDVVATDDTPVARQGSSGGGIFRNNELIGIIAATVGGSLPGELRINAITLDYIDRDIENQTGRNLDDYIEGNLSNLAQSFRSSVAPPLTELLLQN